MTSLYDKMTELADACRKRFGGTSKLTIDDMIKLITPPVFPSGTEILGRTRVSLHHYEMLLTLEAVPPVMSKPIKLLITLSNYDWLMVSNAKLIFHKSDGTRLALDIPDIDMDYEEGKHWVKTVNVTIPANTSIATSEAILKIYGYSEVANIEKIIATY